MERRDFRGYGDRPPNIRWPNGADLAVSFVVNVEEGAELSRADGDERNESIHEINLEVVDAVDLCMETHFAYGPRAGYRRIVEALDGYGVTATFSCCGRAAQRTPWLIADAVARGHEASCHGWRWETMARKTIEEEREIIAKTHAAVSAAAGVAAVGWHTRSTSSLTTRGLLLEHGGFLYDSDAYDDDIPYILSVGGKDHVVLPYSFDTNDMKFQPGGGFVLADHFAEYCMAAFDRLIKEGQKETRMMSVGLHLRTIGRPGRIAGLEKLLEHMTATGGVWFASRAQIARYWRQINNLEDRPAV
ncbi:MAG: polysaccharide deacetylase family protein [Hyphomicrobiaceae bacterium]